MRLRPLQEKVNLGPRIDTVLEVYKEVQRKDVKTKKNRDNSRNCDSLC